MEHKLDFLEFLKTNHPEYKVDSRNEQVLSKLSEWALRSSNFNDVSKGWHIDKGISLSGPVGTGKTRMFFLLNLYLKYLKSEYKFSGFIVWKFAEEFKENSYKCFKAINEEHKNIYFDELALTDEATGIPTREWVSHYGDKLLIGRELIMQMYGKFENYGYQAHFSTNVPFNNLENIYGDRAFSRLFQMTNFITLTGEDRRMDEAPKFKRNMNNPEAPAPKQVDPNEEKENKAIIDRQYQEFCDTDALPVTASLLYNSLVAYGVKVCTDEQMEYAKDKVSKIYTIPASMHTKLQHEKDSDKSQWIWKSAREIMLRSFFKNMQKNNAKSVFGEVAVDLSAEIGKHIKNTQS